MKSCPRNKINNSCDKNRVDQCNLTCRQFTLAYKKILIHAEIREHGVGIYPCKT